MNHVWIMFSTQRYKNRSKAFDRFQVDLNWILKMLVDFHEQFVYEYCAVWKWNKFHSQTNNKNS